MQSEYIAAPPRGNTSPQLDAAPSLRNFLEPKNAPCAPNSVRIPIQNSGQTLSFSSRAPIGLDTVAFSISSTYCDFSPHFKAKLFCPVNTDGTYDREPQLLWQDGDGRPYYGTKAAINTENWQLDILPSGGKANVILKFSAKAFAADNTEVMDAEHLRANIARAQDELSQLGCDANWTYEAHLQRTDIARNAHLEHACSAYVGVFRDNPARVRAGLSSSATRDTYLLMKSGDWQACLYDKGQEQAEKASKSKKHLPSSRIMRGEVRFMKTAEVGKRFGMKKVNAAHLLRSKVFATLPELYADALRASIFGAENMPVEKMTPADEHAQKLAQVQAIAAEFAEPYSLEYYRIFHHMTLLPALGLDAMLAAYREACARGDTEAEKRRRQRYKKELKTALRRFDGVEVDGTGFSRSELAAELRGKLLGD